MTDELSIEELYGKFLKYCHELNELGISPEDYNLFHEARMRLVVFNGLYQEGQNQAALRKIQEAKQSLTQFHDQLTQEGKTNDPEINGAIAHLEEVRTQLETGVSRLSS